MTNNRIQSTDTYFVNFEKEGAFISFEDVRSLGLDPSNWPTVPKETDLRRLGHLTSGRCATGDRYTAAQAFMAANATGGMTRGIQAAARWLGMEYLHSNQNLEREILNRLKGVSRSDEHKEEVSVRPPFCSPTGMEATKEALAEYGFGMTQLNKEALRAVTIACSKSGEGWVPFCTGGRAMGFQDGDTDITLVNNAKGAPYERVAAEIMALSHSNKATEFQMSAGRLIHIPDFMQGGVSGPCDILLSKGGPSAAGKIVAQGLFWISILDLTEHATYFSIIRGRARSCGIIGGPEGLLNMWSVMMTALEFLCIEGVIALSLNVPIAGQEPVCLGFDMFRVPDMVESYFLWLSDRLSDPEFVFGSYSASSKWSNRALSEFSAMGSFRVCRDPFSSNIDNCMRCVSEAKIDWILKQSRHAAYCTRADKHMCDMSRMVARSTVAGDLLRGRLLAPLASMHESMTLTFYKGFYVCCSYPSYGYGISSSETDARMRSIVSSAASPVSDFLLILGDALSSECDGALSVTDVLEKGDSLFYSPPDEDGSIVLGSCEKDYGRQSSPMSSLDRTMAEIIMQYLCLREEADGRERIRKEWEEKIGALTQLTT